MILGVDFTVPTTTVGYRTTSGLTLTAELPSGAGEEVRDRAYRAIAAAAAVLDGNDDVGMAPKQAEVVASDAVPARLSLLEAAGRLVALATDMAKGDGPNAGEALALATVAHRVELDGVDGACLRLLGEH